MFSIFSSKNSSGKEPTLPPLGKTGKIKSVADETFGMEDDVPDNESEDSLVKASGATEDDNYDYRKPVDFDGWIRAVDEQNAVYFYNVKTGESAWLAPCATCYKPSNKYCIDCGKAFCDPDFKKRHEKKSRQKHHWQVADPPNIAKIKPGEVFCIECSLKNGTLMCMDCWDAYCSDCFHIVHSVGALKYHPTMLYSEAKKGWIRIRGETSKDPDMYTHGTSGVTTYEKPYELMNPVERKLYRKFKRLEEATAAAIQEIADLQFEVEKTKFERDSTYADSQSTIKDLHSKSVERSKPQEGNVLDHSKLKGGGGLLSSLFGVNVKEMQYRDKLLNPSDRRRGEARTKYIKEVLETAAGRKVEEEEEAT